MYLFWKVLNKHKIIIVLTRKIAIKTYPISKLIQKFKPTPTPKSGDYIYKHLSALHCIGTGVADAEKSNGI